MQVRCDNFPGVDGCQFIELETDSGCSVAGNWRQDGDTVVLEIPSDFGLTADQYHACLAKLWNALRLVGPQTEDVFTLAVKRIQQLERAVNQQESKTPEDQPNA